MTQICDVIHQLKHQYRSKLNIATIPPASLDNYLHYWNKDTPDEQLSAIKQEINLAQQQTTLEKDINEINGKIIELNIAFDTETINLAEKTYSRSIKKKKKTNRVTAKIKKLRRDILRDGVHSAPDLQHIWYKRIEDVISNAYTNRDKDTDTDEDSGNFKRARNGNCSERAVGSGSGQPSGSKERVSRVGSGSGQPSRSQPKLHSSAPGRGKRKRGGQR